MKLENKKRGFTLVELLAALAIMGIIITMSFYSYSSYKKKSEDKLLLIEKEQISLAANAYVRELEMDSNYSYYTNTAGVSKSCISLKRLQEKGFYTGELDFKNKDYDDAVIKVTKENGVISYDILFDYNAEEDEKGEKHCYYYKHAGNVGDAGGNFEDDKPIIINGGSGSEENNDDIDVETTILQSKDDANSYVMRFQLTADVFAKVSYEKNTYINPIYVSMVLDKSGSMTYNSAGKIDPSGVNRWYNLKIALGNMLNKLETDHGENFYSNVLWFNNNVNVLKTFDQTMTWDTLNSKLGGIATGPQTHIAAGLAEAYASMRKVTDPDAQKYVIVLTDGDATRSDCDTSRSSYCTSSYCNTITGCADKIKGDPLEVTDGVGAVLMIIGYDFSSDTYKTIASSSEVGSKICPDDDAYVSGGKKYCYYDSTSDETTIVNMFASISESIKENVIPRKVDSAEIVIKFNSHIKFYDDKGVRKTELRIPVDFDNLEETKEILKKVYEYDFSTDIDDDEMVCEISDGEGSCSYTANLFADDGFNLIVTGVDGNVNPVSLGESPSIKITKSLVQYIN